MIKPDSNKKHLTYTLSEIYKIYVKERPDWTHIPDRAHWLRIAKKILFKLNLLMIRENLVFKVPGRLGKLGIRKYKNTNKFHIDWKQSRALNKTIYHLNRHSGGYHFRWYWDRRSRSGCSFTNMSFYVFKPTDDKIRREVGKRGLAAWIKELSEDPYRKDYDCLERWL